MQHGVCVTKESGRNTPPFFVKPTKNSHVIIKSCKLLRMQLLTNILEKASRNMTRCLTFAIEFFRNVPIAPRDTKQLVLLELPTDMQAKKMKC